jgi:glucose-6-phosphate 1-dehydrogenase
MRFSYAAAFGKTSANGYERLLLDTILGDATLFTLQDGVEATWGSRHRFPKLLCGVVGPKNAERLLQREGRSWNPSLLQL